MGGREGNVIRGEDAGELWCVGNMTQYLVFLKLGGRHMGTHCISYAFWMSEIFHNLKIDGIEKYLAQLYMGIFSSYLFVPSIISIMILSCFKEIVDYLTRKKAVMFNFLKVRNITSPNNLLGKHLFACLRR